MPPSRVGPAMRPSDRPAQAPEPPTEALQDIVPPRAVLTELARGFLLVHDSSPDRALRFAETFLKEQAGRSPPARVEALPKVTLARLALGRFRRGGVEPLGAP